MRMRFSMKKPPQRAARVGGLMVALERLSALAQPYGRALSLCLSALLSPPLKRAGLEPALLTLRRAVCETVVLTMSAERCIQFHRPSVSADSTPLFTNFSTASMVALGHFTQEVVGASIRTSRDTAACVVG